MKTHLHRRSGALSAETKRSCQQTQSKREAVAKCQPDGIAKTVKQHVQSGNRNTSNTLCCK